MTWMTLVLRRARRGARMFVNTLGVEDRPKDKLDVNKESTDEIEKREYVGRHLGCL